MNVAASRAAARQARVRQDSPALSASEKVNRTLEQTSAVRPEKVARAKALVADGDYPSEADLGKVADLLAQHLGTGDGE
jgi:anti-sigma28 factor (negative regulator of flagellin synthesis)